MVIIRGLHRTTNRKNYLSIRVQSHTAGDGWLQTRTAESISTRGGKCSPQIKRPRSHLSNGWPPIQSWRDLLQLRKANATRINPRLLRVKIRKSVFKMKFKITVVYERKTAIHKFVWTAWSPNVAIMTFMPDGRTEVKRIALPKAEARDLYRTLLKKKNGRVSSFPRPVTDHTENLTESPSVTWALKQLRK